MAYLGCGNGHRSWPHITVRGLPDNSKGGFGVADVPYILCILLFLILAAPVQQKWKIIQKRQKKTRTTEVEGPILKQDITVGMGENDLCGVTATVLSFSPRTRNKFGQSTQIEHFEDNYSAGKTRNLSDL